MRELIIGIVFASLAPSSVPAGTGCSDCGLPATTCVVCRPHQTLRPVEVQQWSVATEAACVSWCNLFPGIGSCESCSAVSCPGGCAAGPRCRCSSHRPRNRLLRKTELRYVPVLEYVVEPRCQPCVGCDDVAGVQLQALPDDQVESGPAPAEASTGKSTVLWIDDAPDGSAGILGRWTAPVRQTKNDATATATVHWVKASTLPLQPQEDLSPIYRVSDLPEIQRSLAAPKPTSGRAAIGTGRR